MNKKHFIRCPICDRPVAWEAYEKHIKECIAREKKQNDNSKGTRKSS